MGLGGSLEAAQRRARARRRPSEGDVQGAAWERGGVRTADREAPPSPGLLVDPQAHSQPLTEPEDVFCCPCVIRDSYRRRKGQLYTLKTANGVKRSAFSSQQLLRPARKAWVWPVGGRARACLLPSALWGAGRASCPLPSGVLAGPPAAPPASAGLLGARRGFRWLCFHAERVLYKHPVQSLGLSPLQP